MSSDFSDDERDMTVERCLHTKFANPRRLSMEMRQMVGDGQFKIEVSGAPFTCDKYRNDGLRIFLDASQRL
jgi:hypothetical protein